MSPWPFKRTDPAPEPTKAQKRRMEKMRQVLRVVCAACKSPKGQYIKQGNRFVCETPGCKYQRKPLEEQDGAKRP